MIIFKSNLLGCEIDSSMSHFKLKDIANRTFVEIIGKLNLYLRLNSPSFDDMLRYVDGKDYELVVQYKNAYEFLFNQSKYDKMNVDIFSKILDKATYCGIEVYRK